MLNRKYLAVAAMLLWGCLGLSVPVLWAGDDMTQSGQADLLDMILIAPKTSGQNPVPAGSRTAISVVSTNPGTAPMPIASVIRLVLTGEDAQPYRVRASLKAEKPSAVPPGGFARHVYGFDLPRGMRGLVRARDADTQTNTVMFYAGPPETVTKAVAETSPEPKPVTAMLPRFQPFFVNFYPYKPVYFLFGADPGVQASSFQVSVKYKLFNFDNRPPENGFKTALDRVYLAYTQQSFWDLKSDSAPFEDSRYMPEIFYYDDDLGLSLPWLIGSGFQVGFQHESNGRGGDLSRSTNYAYVQPSMIFKFTRDLHLAVMPRAWIYVRNDDETNGDLADYRGYFDLGSRFGDPDGLALVSHFCRGRHGNSWQLDLSYPLDQIPGFKGMLDLYLHVQYYTGFSKQLLRYDKQEDLFRIGFSLVR